FYVAGLEMPFLQRVVFCCLENDNRVPRRAKVMRSTALSTTACACGGTCAHGEVFVIAADTKP
ncbi:hypothetical protein C8T65DRAFT_671718, partial [Cerioporus squamosus]